MQDIERLILEAQQIAANHRTGPSVDAILISLAVLNAKRKRQAKRPEQPMRIGEELRMAMDALSGRWATAGELFEKAYGRKPTMGEATRVGVALRQLGMESKRSGGKNLTKF